MLCAVPLVARVLAACIRAYMLREGCCGVGSDMEAVGCTWLGAMRAHVQLY